MCAFAQADVIRGHIAGPDSAPVERALVTVTSLSGSVARSARTDKSGRYTIAFPGGDGDYFVTVAALGFAPKRFQLKRTADQEVLIGDARLSVATTRLDTVRVDVTRQRAARGDPAVDIGGSDRPANNAAVSSDKLGDLASLAASLPGVQLVPSADDKPAGFSVLGAAADQNLVTLNGLTFAGASLPRDAAVSTSLVTSPYDVSRGSFSGGQLDVRTLPGTNYSYRAAAAYVDAPQSQWMTPAARALGQSYRNVSVGGRASGAIAFDKAFYSVAYQAGRRESPWRSLLDTDARGLAAAGLSADSVSRFLDVAKRTGIPVTTNRVPVNRDADNAAILGSFDFAPPGATYGSAYNLTFNATWNRLQGAGGWTPELPAHAGTRENWNAGIQARQSIYYGSGILSETSIGLSRIRFGGSAYDDVPGGTVLTGASSSAGIEMLSFGGNQMAGVSQTTTGAQLTNQLSWFTENNRHRLKLTTDLRREWATQDLDANSLGTFFYNSISDLGADRPASFTRTLGVTQRDEAEYLGAVSLGDAYRPSDALQVQYGVRVDGNRFAAHPQRNADVEHAFGVRNDRAPDGVFVSPRVGFAWTYGRTRQIAAFDGASTPPRGVVRGGIGLFQGMLNAGRIGDAVGATGLTSGMQQVTCVGSAVPMPDWNRYAADASSIPTRCADATVGTSLASAAPDVVLFDRAFTPPKSLRTNLQWSGPILGDRFSLSADVTYSLNLAQPDVRDLNLDPTPRFSLMDDGRPVFAPSSAIVASTGAIGIAGSRRASTFGRVLDLQSDMRSDARQLTLQLRPRMLNTRVAWAISYVYAQIRDRVGGFASTSGSPFGAEWARSSFDSRHQFVYAFTYNAMDVVRLSWYGTLRSGTPYTPVVASDINGDGQANDRAFIVDPTNGANTEAAAMRNLLASRVASSCLSTQLGKIAARNSCEGPWSATGVLTASLNPQRAHLPQRADVSLQLANPLGAADALLHGSNGLRGWGQPFDPENRLLFVRGFDPATRRFVYDVNSRFGRSRTAQSGTLAPISLTAIVRIDVGPTRERQALTQMLDRGRSRPGPRLNDATIKSLYGTSSIINPMTQLLREADSLGLTPEQSDSIAMMNRRFTVTLDSVWSPVSRWLAALPEQYSAAEAYAAYTRAREATVDALMHLAPSVRSLLTVAQRRRLPSSIAQYLDTRYLASVRSGTSGTGLGAIMTPDGLALPPGVGSATSAVITMIHGGGTP